ncbi:helix-turn-helix domain-containing protein [Cohnella soli]|uniref:Helix-turn-helix domain-containing protein n=1 Tax=Cohnella soli TaxID=425005 RepID=A0ABW0HQD5_9BACL
MNIRPFFGAKSYFVRTVLWISVAILFIIGVLSTVVFLKTQSLFVKNQYASNQKILYQVKYNMGFMDQTIGNLCKTLYLNNDVSAIMYAKQEDMVDVANRLNKVVSSITSANPYIHSISIYNRNLDQAYNAGSPLFFEDKLLLDIYNNDQSVPKMKPIFRDIKKLVNGKEEPDPVFSYVIYETSAGDLKPDGVVIINVRSKWLIDNIQQINMVDKRNGDNVFMMDQSGQYLDDGTGDQAIMKWLRADWVSYRNDHPEAEPDGFFQSKHDGTSYLITYSNVDSAGMTLLKTQPVFEVYKYIKSLKTSIALITLVVVLLALALSIAISRRIYRPVGKLVSSVKSDRVRRSDHDVVIDEFSYLNTVYRQSMEQLDLFDKEKYQYKDVMKHYWLSRLLTEGPSIPQPELRTIFKEMKFALPVEGEYAVCILKLDNYKELQHTFTSKDRETIRFAMINIASEIVARKYPNEGLDMKDDHVLLLVNVPEGDDMFPSDMIALLKDAQETVSRYFKVSFTASISDSVNRLGGLHDSYNHALDQSMYRLLLGHSSVITSETVKKKAESKKTGYSKELEEWLVETIKSGNVPAMKKVLATLFEETSTLNYHNALVTIIRLADAVFGAMEHAKGSSSIALPLSSITRSLLEKETIGEIHRTLWGVLQDSFSNEQLEAPNTMNHFVVDAVTEYIHKNYQDASLSLSSVAAMMKLSTRNLSKIYKEATQISIPDYINEFRLAKAAELLIHHDLSVIEVSKRVGILNETYFFSLFKKKYKVTPKEYALQRNVNRVIAE